MRPINVFSGMTRRVFPVDDRSLLKDMYIIKGWVSIKDSFTMSYKYAVSNDHNCRALQKPHSLMTASLIKMSITISGAHRPSKK